MIGQNEKLKHITIPTKMLVDLDSTWRNSGPEWPFIIVTLSCKGVKAHMSWNNEKGDLLIFLNLIHLIILL